MSWSYRGGVSTLPTQSPAQRERARYEAEQRVIARRAARLACPHAATLDDIIEGQMVLACAACGTVVKTADEMLDMEGPDGKG